MAPLSTAAWLIIVAGLVVGNVCGVAAFVQPGLPSSPASGAWFRASVRVGVIKATNDDESDVTGGGGAVAPSAEKIEDGEDVVKTDAVAAIVGISGLAGAGATAASTAATTAGAVCAGGACVAGAGAAATAGGAAAGAGVGSAAVAGGGLLAGAKAILVGGALAAGVAFKGLSGRGGGDALEAMVQSSTPLEVLAQRNGRPTVMEFYGNACPHCHDAALQLRAVEESAIRSEDFNWVMVNTDDPRMAPLWTAYNVDELPHFEFFDAEGHEVAFEVGDIGVERIKERMAQTSTQSSYMRTSGSSISTASSSLQ